MKAGRLSPRSISQILDVLGATAGVVALTKRDLVDDEVLALAQDEIRERLAGTMLAEAPIVPVSSESGDGVDALRGALDDMLDHAPDPDPGRTRLFVDRVFTIKGAGTVVTGTLTGGCLSVDDDVVLFPSARRARIRSLQSHRSSVERACPVSRVAVNLVGVERDDLARGDVLTAGEPWRPTREFEAVVRTVRGLRHGLGSRGAYKIYAGSAETDARIRIYPGAAGTAADEAFVRARTSEPLTLDVFDRFVLRDAGRRETVGGGEVLDVAPPSRAGADAAERLAARRASTRDDLPELLAAERGAIPVAEAAALTGSRSPGGVTVGAWFVRAGLREEAERAVTSLAARHHADHPMEEGVDVGRGRAGIAETLRGARVPPDPDLIGALLRDMVDRGALAASATTIRLPEHGVVVDEHDPDVARLLQAIGGDAAVAPPTISELGAAGIDRGVIEAASRAGLVVQVSPELVFTPGTIERARSIVRAATDGITVSAFRQSLETSRKFALPILEHFDRAGETRRDGDLRFPR